VSQGGRGILARARRVTSVAERLRAVSCRSPPDWPARGHAFRFCTRSSCSLPPFGAWPARCSSAWRTRAHARGAGSRSWCTERALRERARQDTPSSHDSVVAR